MKRFILLTLIYTLFTCSLKAQNAANTTTGLVTGKVIDAANKQPVAFGTVVLVKKADNLPAKSIQTDLDGNFKLENLPFGKYLLRITYVGYATFFRDSIFITSNRKVYALGTLGMRAGKTSQLSEVKVESKKESIQLGIDRKVFSVGQSLVSEGGSATDLLANVPSVSVDVDGNVNLRGSSNVRILIDGKPSLLAGGSVSDILQSIPASSIETIELITNPSSKYDPEGQSGIINIVLKKNKSLGFNGSASLSAGTYNTYNGNLSLAYQHKKVNIYGNYSHRQGDRSGGGFNNRNKLLDTASDIIPYQYNQNSTQKGSNNGNQIKAGIDFNFTDKSTIGFSSNINFRNNDRSQNSITNVYNHNQNPLQQLLGNTNSVGSGNNHDFNLDYSTKFNKPKEEFTANLSLAQGDENNVDSIFNQTITYLLNKTVTTKQFNLNTGNTRNYNIQADYTDPIGKNGKLELGYRGTLNRAENDFAANIFNFANNGYAFDPTISTDFVYDEKIHGIYSNYQQQFGQFGIQGGARVEKTIINTNLVNFNTSHVQDYFRVYPSLFLTDKLTEDQTLQLSYSRRINRPRDRQIIPFLDRSDLLNFRIGNPDLKPEDVHSFELSYAKYWKSTTLTSSLYYRRTNDIFQFVRTPYDATGITITSFQNFAYGTNAGFEFIARTDITSKWNITSNVNVYQGFIKGGIIVVNGKAAPPIDDTKSFAYNGNLTSNFQLPLNLSGQLRVDYQAPQAIAQGRSKANSGVDAALKYEFYKRKASLSLNGRDIFNTRKFGYVTDDALFHNNVDRRFQSRTFLFTLSYRLGSKDLGKGRDKGDKGSNNSQPDDNGGAGAGGPQ
jgi:outer membrane receptor protein involved in Fe transport